MCSYINIVNVIDVNLRLLRWVDIVNNRETVSLRIFLGAGLDDCPEGASNKNSSFSLMTG